MDELSRKSEPRGEQRTSPPTAPTGREALCVAVELGQTSFMQLRTSLLLLLPLNPSTHEHVAHPQPERVRLAHGQAGGRSVGRCEPAALTLRVGGRSTYILS